MSESSQKKTLVIGQGWSALLAISYLSQNSNENLYWVTGEGATIHSPLSLIESDLGASVWQDLCVRFEIPAGELEKGRFLREFKNKTFREMPWSKPLSPSEKEDLREQFLWGCEHYFVPLKESRFFWDIEQIENSMLEFLNERLENHSRFERLKNIDIASIREGDLIEVEFKSGESLTFDRVIYADRWSSLKGIDGLSKKMVTSEGQSFSVQDLNRKWLPTGVLQVTFTHDRMMGGDSRWLENFVGTPIRETGETTDRRVWGHYLDGSRKSRWTLFLTPDETEDNRLIAKKMRRIKQVLNKMFASEPWIDADTKQWTDTIVDEHVSFEEKTVFVSPDLFEGIVTTQRKKNLYFLTDGLGPSFAAAQVGRLMNELDPEFKIPVCPLFWDEENTETPPSTQASSLVELS